MRLYFSLDPKSGPLFPNANPLHFHSVHRLSLISETSHCLVNYVSPIQSLQICRPPWTPEPPSLVFPSSRSQILSHQPLGHLLWRSPTPLQPHLELTTLDTRHYQWAGILCSSHALGHHGTKFIMFSQWKKDPRLLLLCSGGSTEVLVCCTLPRHLSLNFHAPQFAYYNVESDHLCLRELSHQPKTR